MKPNRMKLCMSMMDILDEVKGDIAEKREFLKAINSLFNKPGASLETLQKYMDGGK